MNLDSIIWAASSEFGTYHLCGQRRFRWACPSAPSRQNLCCSPIQAVSQEQPSDKKQDPWPLWMAGHAQLKFVMTESSNSLNAPHIIFRLQYEQRNILFFSFRVAKSQVYEPTDLENAYILKQCLKPFTQYTCNCQERPPAKLYCIPYNLKILALFSNEPCQANLCLRAFRHDKF